MVGPSNSGADLAAADLGLGGRGTDPDAAAIVAALLVELLGDGFFEGRRDLSEAFSMSRFPAFVSRCSLGETNSQICRGPQGTYRRTD